jgi:glycosyltransferase involved in cell wall biosynthesis
VTVVVPVRDRRDLLGALLDGLAAQTFTDVEVIVVDDGSSDGSGELAASRTVAGRPVRVLRQDGGGAVRARQAGVALAAGEILAFTDSDCVPDPGWLAAGVAAIDSGVAVVQGHTRSARRRKPLERSLWVEDDGLYPTCNVFYRRDALLGTGGFGEGLGFFGEDTVAGWSVERAGWRSAWAPDAVVEHIVTTPGFGWHLRRARYYANWPALMRAFPEKRDLLWHRVFLRRRSAEADAAVLAVLASVVLTSPWPLVAALPFWWRHMGRHWSTPSTFWHEGARGAVFDLAISAALVRGSLRHRTPVL